MCSAMICLLRNVSSARCRSGRRQISLQKYIGNSKTQAGRANEPDEAAAPRSGLVFVSTNCRCLATLSRAQDAELLQRGCSIVQPDFLGDLAVLHTKHGGSRESHFPAGGRGQRADEKVAEGRAGVRAAAFPAADDMVAFGNE